MRLRNSLGKSSSLCPSYFREETLPEEETEERKADKEQTQSLRALAGSFTPSNEITSAPCAAEPLPCD